MKNNNEIIRSKYFYMIYVYPENQLQISFLLMIVIKKRNSTQSCLRNINILNLFQIKKKEKMNLKLFSNLLGLFE